MEINKIYLGNCLEILKTFPDESINCCVTSPPYWALRNYSTEPQLWDGKENCRHEWNQLQKTLTHKSGETNPGKEGWYKDKGASDDKSSCFCCKCSAWYGSLGLESDFRLYIKHLCDIFDEIKRALKKDGTCWVVIGDTYGGSGNRKGHTLETSNLNRLTIGYGGTEGNQQNTKGLEKCLLGIPERFKIEMVDNRGWTHRNTIIWHKPNCMPSSATDRFTVDFEYIFFFVKNKKYWFETQREPHTQIDRRGNNRIKYQDRPDDVDGGGTFLGQNPQGRNKRCVWTISTKSFPDAHFAVFPPELIIDCIKAGCPEDGIVLDPFFGSGTTGEVALRLNRKFIGIELNSEYIKIADKRLYSFLQPSLI